MKQVSDYASVAERARRAFASISRMESALAHSPDDPTLQINLAARMKHARQLQEELRQLAQIRHVELCDYRLLPEQTDRYFLPHVAKSLIEYQNVFSQIHDAVVNGPKKRAILGKEAIKSSMMEVGYTYSGSLGVVLLAPSEQGLFDGSLDNSIDALFQVMDIQDQYAVRDIAKHLGEAVVKRVHDWSKSNIDGGFAVDVKWNRSDGRQLGQVIGVREMERIVSIIDETSDEHIDTIRVDGILIGINLKAGNFHFVVPEGDDYRGGLDEEFQHKTVEVGRRYTAEIRVISKISYATGHEDRKHQLVSLVPEQQQGLETFLA